MAVIRPFCAIRPKMGLEHCIAALPYDVYSRNEAKEEIIKEPLSFLRIDRAETQFEDNVNIYSEKVYQKAKEILWEMVDDGCFVQDETPCYYIYELTMEQRSQTGIVACAGVDDYLNGTIKKHENTREDKEIDRIQHVNICQAQTGPIFLAYHQNSILKNKIEIIKKENSLYNFTADDGIQHKVWKIENPVDCDEIEQAFNNINSIYIADGHHRCASAAKVAMMRRGQVKNTTGMEEFNYFLSVLFPDDELMIMDYNRLIKDLNGMTTMEFLEELKKVCEVEVMKASTMGTELLNEKPNAKGRISMYLEGKWYNLIFGNRYYSNNPVQNLDVSILQDNVLKPILGISDPKIDNRIDFVGGIRGLKELERRVNDDCKVAFAMYPPSIEELFHVSDAGLLMPPKSTWFEPKLRSGLFIHSIK